MQTRSRTLAVLLFDEVELLDVAGAVQVASVAGRHWNWRPFGIVPVGLKAGPIRTRNQITLIAEAALDACPRPDVLLLPGGYGARKAAECAPLVDWCRQSCEAAEWVLMSGAGSAVAAAAGCLGGQRVAAKKDDLSWLRPLCEEVQYSEDSPLERSGKFLSSAHGAGSIELALALVHHSLSASLAQRLRKTFDLEPPPVRLSLQVEGGP